MKKSFGMVKKVEMELEMLQQEEKRHEEKRGRVAHNMEAGGSHPQVTSDPGKEETDTNVELSRL